MSRSRRPRWLVPGVLTLITGVANLVAPAAGSAQTLRGLLLEADVQRPIALGRITMLTEDRDSVAATLTNEDGFFTITAPEGGTYSIVASALGYRGSLLGPYELDDGELRVIELQLRPRPIPVAGVSVSAERLEEPEVAKLVATGFYDRLVEGRGEFVTPGEIERSTVRYTTQLFREMPTVVLQQVRGDRASAPWNDRVMIRPIDPNAVGVGSICRPRVYVDDVFIDLARMDPEPSLEDLVAKDDLEAIEVYREVGAPNRYMRTSPCGVVLLWTKLRR